MSSSIGIDASLAILRQQLEGMQTQDKAIYAQLLTLQESIRGLKAELRKEREECEEAFKDLEENSRKDSEDELFMEETTTLQNLNETAEEKGATSEEIWKHDRQDSGISVKTPDVETHDMCSQTTKFYPQDLVIFSTCTAVSKPAIILHDLDSHVKTTNVEITQKTTSLLKPPLIQHSKQDSGILIDEEAVKETTLLSRLAESSEMFEKLETRKYDRLIQNTWQKVRENSPENKNHHQRSRSSNDLLLNPQPQRNLSHQNSMGNLRPKHAHTKSCPQNMLKQFSSQEKQLHSVDKPPLNQFTELDKLDLKLRKSQDRPTQRSTVPSELNTFVLRSGSVSPTPRSIFKTNIIPKHLHTRSLPSTSIRGLITAANELNRQDNRRSMQNISQYKVVPTHQIRPRQRSASVVHLENLKEATQDSVAQGTGSAREKSDGLAQDKNSTKESSQTPHSSQAEDDNKSLNKTNDNVTTGRIPTLVIDEGDQSFIQAKNKVEIVHINHLDPAQEIKTTQDKSNETGELVKATKPLRAVLVSAREVNVSNTTERLPLSRRCSLDERSTGNYRPSVGPQRRFTIMNVKPGSIPQPPRQQFVNGKYSPRFLTSHLLHNSRNHLRHHTMPEHDVMRRRHSLNTWHAPSKSWDGYSRKTNEVKGITRSASHVSLV